MYMYENVIVLKRVKTKPLFMLGLTASNSWTDGSSVTFNQLTSTLVDSQCSSMSLSGDWIINDCNEQKTVLCKRGIVIIILSV